MNLSGFQGTDSDGFNTFVFHGIFLVLVGFIKVPSIKA